MINSNKILFSFALILACGFIFSQQQDYKESTTIQINSLDSVEWLLDYQTWIARKTSIVRLDTFQSTFYTILEDDKWCYKVTVIDGTIQKEFYFFQNDDLINPKAVLQQVVFFDRRNNTWNKSLAKSLDSSINGELDKKFGKASELHDEMELNGFVFEKCNFRKSKTLRIFVHPDFHNDGERSFKVVKLVVRHQFLADLLEKVKKTNELLEKKDRKRKDIVRTKLFRGISKRTLKLSILKTEDLQKPISLNYLVEFKKYVDSMHSKDSDYYSLLLYSMNYFTKAYVSQLNLQKWIFSEEEVEERKIAHQKSEAIIGAGLDIQFLHIGTMFAVSGDALKKLVNTYPNNYWGKEAFFDMIQSGWCYDNTCIGDYGPEVIKQVLQFLKTNPDSPHRSLFLLTIAKAFESSWSHSYSSNSLIEDVDTDSVDRQKLRLEAVRFYHTVLMEFPNSIEADVARLRLPRLVLDIPSNNHDFIKFYD